MLNISDNKIEKTKMEQNGRLAVHYKNGEVKSGIRPRRLFPLTRKNKYINLVDTSEQEIGILTDLRALDRESRNNINTCLDRYYVLPKVVEIMSIEDKYGVGRWHVITDRGEKEFEVLNYNTDIKKMGGGHYIIIDSDDNRYEVPDINKLDTAGRRLFEDRL